jgi:hypothetical protein
MRRARVLLLWLSSLGGACGGSGSSTAGTADTGTAPKSETGTLPSKGDGGYDAHGDARVGPRGDSGGAHDATKDTSVDARGDATDAAGIDATLFPEGGPDASEWASPSMWLCGANAAHDYCKDPEAVTAIAPNLAETTTNLTPATDPPLDCFYVYPSVDIADPPGNLTTADFTSMIKEITDPVFGQAAPFTQVCKVYAPFYHQATFQSYTAANADQYLEIAYADVAAAFQEYWLKYNDGRPFVLLGHSQGSHMLRRLIQRVVETTPAIEQQMRLAILAGSLGDYTVPKGGVVGGSFQKTPLCTAVAQKGCALSFSTYGEGYPPEMSYPDFPVPSGMDVACSNPAAPGGGPATLSNSWIYTAYQSPMLKPPESAPVTTPFATYADFYTGDCVPSSTGYSYFEVSATPGPGDERTNPIDFANVVYTPIVIGLHLVDYDFPMGDLLDAVRARWPDADAGPVDAHAE